MLAAFTSVFWFAIALAQSRSCNLQCRGRDLQLAAWKTGSKAAFAANRGLALSLLYAVPCEFHKFAEARVEAS
jgi:hypothetical protein